MFILVEEPDNTSRIVNTLDIRAVVTNILPDGYNEHSVVFYNDDLKRMVINLSPKEFYKKHWSDLNVNNS